MIAAGAAAAHWLGTLSIFILVLLGLLFASYRQTITTHPNGGGAYTVAKENLGTGASLVAAAALSLDYVLNVAVAISAGVGAVVSAIPALLPVTLPLCLFVLLLLVIVNLRGFRASGGAFLLPTYLFIACMLVVIGLGSARAVASGMHPAPVVPVHPLAAPTEAITAWLVLRAFASGCTAMTGVEAVSNGVPMFREPKVVHARRTLAAIVAVLAVMLAGVAFLCRVYHVGATPPATAGYESVLSQLTHAVLGRGWLYGVTMASVFAVLALSANTSFAGFPRLCQLVAQDRFLPEAFIHRGRRLSFSHGIIVLGVFSAALLIAFRGVTDRLIPLFAIGAFLAFTMSQAGMVVHWHKKRARFALVPNGLGAIATAATFVIVLASKLREGAWISAVVIMAMLLLYGSVKRHYDLLARALTDDAPFSPASRERPLAIVPIRRWNKLASDALAFASGIAEDVIAVQVVTEEEPGDDLEKRWPELVARPCEERRRAAPRLEVARSRFREPLAPLVDFIHRVAATHPERTITVVVPKLVERQLRYYLMHNTTAAALRAMLVYRGARNIVVLELPWHLADFLPERRSAKGPSPSALPHPAR